MTDLAELVLRIRADASSLDRELKKASGTVVNESSKMGSALSGLSRQFAGLAGVISVASFVSFAKNASLAADRLNDLSARTGIAATTLSALELPLKQSGSSADEFASSITRMNNAIGEAASGQSEAAARAFTDLGLSIQDLMAMSPEQQFNEIARALSEIDNQAEFTNKGMAIFGRQFASIAPIIRETNGEIDTFVKRQQELGLAFSAEELQAVNDFWDSIEGYIKKTEVALVSFLVNLAKVKDIGSADNAARNAVRAAAFDAEVKRAQAEGRPFNENEFRKKANEVASRITTVKPETVDVISGLQKQQQRTSGASSNRTITQTVKETTQAQEDFNSHVTLYKEHMKEAKEETERFNKVLKDKLSGGLTDAVFSANSAGDAFRRLGEQLARSIFEKSIAEPFSGAVVDAVSKSGLGSSIGSFFGGLLPSFDVGSPNIPSDMIAQIHKGERIVPANQNNPAGLSALAGGGGNGVVVNQYFQTGVTRSELQAILPQVAAAASDSVFAKVQQGGSAAKIMGVR